MLDILQRPWRGSENMREPAESREVREIISILMESSFYFDLPLKERILLIRTLMSD